MKKNCRRISGFTAVEVLMSTAILSLAMAAAISGWLYVFRGEKMNSVQNELDMDVRKDTPFQRRVTVKKVVMTQQYAEEEVGRLNHQNASKGVQYIAMLTELDETEREI